MGRAADAVYMLPGNGRKKRGPEKTGPHSMLLCRWLEFGHRTRIEEAAACVVDRAARTDAGQAERRLLVEQIVDADVEVEVLGRIETQANVVVEYRRILLAIGIVRVFRRTTLQRIEV